MPPPFAQVLGGTLKIATWNANSLAHLVAATRRRKTRYLEHLARQLHVLPIQETHMASLACLVESAPLRA